MNSRLLKVRSIVRQSKSSGEFLFRRHNRGPADQITQANAKLSRTKVSSK